MAIKGIRLAQERDYHSVYDEALVGSPEATIWKLGTIDSRLAAKLRDMATTMSVNTDAPNEEVKTSINVNEVNYATVQYGLRGVANFVDEQGNQIAFKTVSKTLGGASYRVVDPEVMKQIPLAVINELAEELRKGNELSVVEAKK